jgi:hypothetical protein
MEGPLLFGACCHRGSELTIGATWEGSVAVLSILVSSLNFKLLCLWTCETCICFMCGVPSETLKFVGFIYVYLC